MFLDRFLGSRRRRAAAYDLYVSVVEQARSPSFYEDLGVPDTVDGRFDLIALHAFLVLHRCKQEGDEADETAQAFFDLFFGDMDRSLREMGVGDLSVGKRVKEMVAAFLGRVEAYEAGLSADGPALEEALLRNLYRGQHPGALALSGLTAYVRGEADALAEQDKKSLCAGRVRFGHSPRIDNLAHGSD
ncbi:MAG: ubiquinol-cytochrome C chaperone family protein [Sphingomonadales bacterium]